MSRVPIRIARYLLFTVMVAGLALSAACDKKSPAGPTPIEPKPTSTPAPAPSTSPDAKVRLSQNGMVEVETRAGQKYNSVEEWAQRSPDHFSGGPLQLQVTEVQTPGSESTEALFGLYIDSRIDNRAYPNCPGCNGQRQVRSLVVTFGRDGGASFTLAAGVWLDGRRICLAASAGSESKCNCFDTAEELIEALGKEVVARGLQVYLGIPAWATKIFIEIVIRVFTPNIALAPASMPRIVSPDSLPGGTVGLSYLATLLSSQGVQPHSWTVVSGKLPDGLSLATSGTIAGTPRASGALQFDVCVADAYNLTDSRTYIINVGAPGTTPPTPTPSPTPPPGTTPPPTLPPAPPPGPGPAPAPSVFGVQNVTSSSSNQTVGVTGSGFQSGLTVTVYLPNNAGVSTLSGTQVRNVTASSFDMFATLNGSGTWAIRVNNPDGQVSPVFQFSVQGSATPPSPSPGIAGISPATPTSSTANQTVSVSGSGFQSGLTVAVYWPNGSGSSTLSGTQIQNVGNSSFQMLITLNGAGVWGLRVTNPNGLQSNLFQFGVNAPAAPSATLRIDGQTSSSRSIGQTFSFTGSGFTPGQTVTRHVSPAINGSSILSPTISADGSGNLAWTFSPTCGNPIGAWTIWITDDASGRVSNSVTETVTANSNCNTPSLQITTSALPAATAGTGYAQPVSATGGAAPYTWSASNLPPGLSINSTTGAVFGTPTTAGSYSLSVTVRDSGSSQQVATRSVALTVSAPATPSIPGAFSITAMTPGCSGGSPTITIGWSASSNVTTYELYRNGSLYSPGIPSNTLSFYNSANLVSGSVYTYFVRARNSAGFIDTAPMQMTARTGC